ncbi:hypothetical protein C5167_020557, partial [Papaver somniferum]
VPEFGEGKSIVDWVRSKVKTEEGVAQILGLLYQSVRKEVAIVLRVAFPAERPSMMGGLTLGMPKPSLQFMWTTGAL